MTHGSTVDRWNDSYRIVCLCTWRTEWMESIHHNANQHPNTNTALCDCGFTQYQQHVREAHQIDEPSAHKWVQDGDGIETCEHCDMVRTV